MKSLFLEIRAAEGGADAKDLVRIQTAMYIKLASKNSL
jgi:protein subunit release factor B